MFLRVKRGWCINFTVYIKLHSERVSTINFNCISNVFPSSTLFRKLECIPFPQKPSTLSPEEELALQSDISKSFMNSSLHFCKLYVASKSGCTDVCIHFYLMSYEGPIIFKQCDLTYFFGIQLFTTAKFRNFSIFVLNHWTPAVDFPGIRWSLPSAQKNIKTLY